MRPRVFPRKTRISHSGGSPDFCASMRPRVFPAEDGISSLEYTASKYSASMRPRDIPRGRREQEHDDFPRRNLLHEAAGIPAEDAASFIDDSPPRKRFNEAAGIPAEDRRPVRRRHARDSASMRPRVFPRKTQQTCPCGRGG